MKNSITFLLVLLSALSAHAQKKNEIALNVLRIRMPLTQEYAWGGEVHYRYRWTPHWSVAMALGYHRLSTWKGISAFRVTYSDSYLAWDGYISRSFSFASPFVLSLGIGISVGYSSSYEIDAAYLPNGKLEYDFRPYRAFTSYVLLTAEMGLPISDRLTLTARPIFRYPVPNYSHPPMIHNLSMGSPLSGVSQTTTIFSTYTIPLGIALGAAYRF